MFVSLGLGCAAGSEGGREFVDQLSPAERKVLGIETMTGEQIAALEAAGQRFAASRSEAAKLAAAHEVRGAMAEELTRRDAVITQTRQELAETKSALQEKDTAAKESLLERFKVMLLPGTKVEYTKLESRLAEPFKGWTKGTQFRLENGQTWEVVEGEYWAKTQPAGKLATVVPGVLGSFFLEIEGVNQRPRVRIVSN